MSRIRIKVINSETPWKIKWLEADRLCQYCEKCEKKGDFNEAVLAIDQAITLTESGIHLKQSSKSNGKLSKSVLKKMKQNLLLVHHRKKLLKNVTENKVRYILNKT